MSKLAKDYLKSELEGHVQKAREITRKAEDENRNLTDAERGEIESHLADAKKARDQIHQMDENDKLAASIEDLGKAMVSGDGEEPVDLSTLRTPGERFVKSVQYQALLKRGFGGSWSTGPIDVPAVTGAKDTTFVSEANVGTTGGSMFLPQVIPGIQEPVAQRLTIADLLGSGSTSNNSIMIVKETVTQPGSGMGPLAEGAAKPETHVDFDTLSVPVVKLATFLPVSDEMLEDIPAIQSYLNSRLAFFVGQAEETKLLHGAGGGDITGILTNAGSAVAADVGGTNLFDAILAAITDVRVNGGMEPDGVVMSPITWAKLAAAKASTSGTYFSGGPYTSAANNPWGLRTVVTTAIADDHVLVGNFAQGATVFRKGGLTIEASNSHSDYFTKNLTAIRAEERLALAIYRNAAFSVATVS